MEKNQKIAKILGIIGMVLVWFPILATIMTSPIVSNISQKFRVDYLLPAELFPIALLGGILLFVAAWLSKSRKFIFGLLLGLKIFFFLGIVIVAQVTGLASGERASGDWATVLTMGMLGAYILCLFLLCIFSIVQVRDLFRVHQKD